MHQPLLLRAKSLMAKRGLKIPLLVPLPRSQSPARRKLLEVLERAADTVGNRFEKTRDEVAKERMASLK